VIKVSRVNIPEIEGMAQTCKETRALEGIMEVSTHIFKYLLTCFSTKNRRLKFKLFLFPLSLQQDFYDLFNDAVNRSD
jgi:hypothetical protein